MKVVEIESEESVSKIQFKEGKTSNIGSEKSN